MLSDEKDRRDETIQLVVAPGCPLRGVVRARQEGGLPGDKSLSHRAALLGAMADGSSTIRNFLVSGVTRAMLESLASLGVGFQLDGSTLKIEGVGLEPQANLPETALQCGNSATTMRLLAGALAAWGRASILDGSPGLRRRPMRRIIEPLQQMGVAIEGADGCAPLKLGASPRPLKAVSHRLAVASAQVKSCLLLAALAADGETTILEPGPSRDHTERMLQAMGVGVRSGLREPGSQAGVYRTRLQPPSPLVLAPLDVTLPGDMSAAAFLIVAALITPGSEVRLEGVGLNPTRTGLLDALLEMGAEIRIERRPDQGGEPLSDLTVCHSRLRGIQVSGERVVRMIDEFPAFSAAAAWAEGETLVRDAQELRNKESDRIEALGEQLRKLGVEFRATPDGFAMRGGSRPSGGMVAASGDHRLAMSLALIGLNAHQPVTVQGAEVVSESFPDFPGVLRSLGADIRTLSGAGEAEPG